jgi:diguanylate cyclase
VSSRSRSREWLLEHSQRLARVGSWTWDLRRNRFTWSASMFPLYGLPAGSPPPTPAAFLDLVHPEDRARYRAAVRQALRTGGSHELEHRVVTPSGEVRHIAGFAEVRMGPDGRPVDVIGSAQDQTVRVERDRAVAQSEQLHRLIVDSSPIGIAVLDLAGRWIQVNDALCRIVGRPAAALLGRSYRELCVDTNATADARLRADLVSGRRARAQDDRRLVRACGVRVWVEAHLSLLRAPELHRAPRLLAQVLDVTERRRVAQELTRQARTDPLTGLANRREWQDRLDRCLAASTGGPLAVAIVDMDRFKAFNDTYGHAEGDELLVDTARRWQERLAGASPEALLARLGGEEFGVLLPGLPHRRARELLAGLVSAPPRGQTASVGFTLARPGDQSRTVMSRADCALYRAKQRGRARVEARWAPVPEGGGPTPPRRRPAPDPVSAGAADEHLAGARTRVRDRPAEVVQGPGPQGPDGRVGAVAVRQGVQQREGLPGRRGVEVEAGESDLFDGGHHHTFTVGGRTGTVREPTAAGDVAVRVVTEPSGPPGRAGPAARARSRSCRPTREAPRRRPGGSRARPAARRCACPGR